MERQHLAAVVAAVLASVLATGMSIEPKRATAPVTVKLPDTTAGVVADPATAPPLMSPDGYRKYIAAVLEAEALQDPVKRCLAYPALPGNEWPKEMVEALCALAPMEGSLDEAETVLKQPDGGAELDRRYAALLEAHYNDPKRKDHIFRAYDIFDASPHAAAVAQAWVQQSPNSAYARTARAWQLVESGWKARGTKFMRQTPGDKVRRMENSFARSIPDLDFALKQNPRLLPACDRLISIGASSSNLLQDIGSNLCLKADPTSYRVIKSLLWSVEPKWGGSQEQMRGLVAMARAQEDKNPALAALRNFQAGYEAAADRGDNQFARTAPTLERVSRLSPGYLQDTSRALVNLDRSWDAFVYASQAIRFNPDDGSAYYDRSNALRKLNAYELAIEDAKRSKAFDGDDGWADLEMIISLYHLKRYEALREHAIAAMAYPATRKSANEYLCRSYGPPREFDKMAECTEKLVIDFPLDDEAWRLRALAYKNAGSPKMYDAVDDFLQHADPQSQATEIKMFKAWLLGNPRPQSAASVPSSAPTP